MCPSRSVSHTLESKLLSLYTLQHCDANICFIHILTIMVVTLIMMMLMMTLMVMMMMMMMTMTMKMTMMMMRRIVAERSNAANFSISPEMQPLLSAASCFFSFIMLMMIDDIGSMMMMNDIEWRNLKPLILNDR